MSAVVKRSVAIRGHRTSFSLETPFFEGLALLARRRSIPLATLVADIDAGRDGRANLSSALRLHVLEAAKAGALVDFDEGQSNPA